jgi:dihydroxy-acid dehydratase
MAARGTNAWAPLHRERAVSPALQAYAALTTNAARGAVRDVAQINSR